MRNDPYLKNLRYAECLKAFERTKATIVKNGGVAIVKKGRRVRMNPSHGGNPRILEQRARKACKILEIDWDEFVSALRR